MTVGRMQSSSLVVHLEAPLILYENTEVPARDIVLLALRWDTPHWPSLAVAWLEQGLAMDDEIAAQLDSIASRSTWPQRLRHRTQALLRSWRSLPPAASD